MPQAISDLQRTGKVFGDRLQRGHAILNEVQSGAIIGTLDQRYDNQSAGFVQGCGNFLFGNKLPTWPDSYVNPYHGDAGSTWSPTASSSTR